MGQFLIEPTATDACGVESAHNTHTLHTVVHKYSILNIYTTNKSLPAQQETRSCCPYTRTFPPR